MAKRVVIDLDVLRKADAAESIRCVYFYHPSNDGVATLREIAGFEHYCRKCERAACIESCPTGALEKNADGVVVRANLRCVGCMSCSRACPFGTIMEEALLFHHAGCDYCESLGSGDAEGVVPGTLSGAGGAGRKLPGCVESCTTGALEYREVGAEEAERDGVVLVGERLAVKGRRWSKEDVRHTDGPRKEAAGGK